MMLTNADVTNLVNGIAAAIRSEMTRKAWRHSPITNVADFEILRAATLAAEHLVALVPPTEKMPDV